MFPRSTNRSAPYITAVVRTLEVLEARETPAAGELDFTFGSTGQVVVLQAFQIDVARAVVRPMSSGTLIVGETFGLLDPVKTLLVRRLDDSGAVTHTESVQLPSDLRGVNAVELTSGQLLISSNKVLMRLNANGTRDTSFGTNGTVPVPVETSSILFFTLPQSDGSVYITYTVSTGATTQFQRIARLTPAGSLDTGFGTNGFVDLAVNDYFLQYLATDSSGRLIIAGGPLDFTGSSLTVRRFTTVGQPDAGFGTGGVMNLATQPSARGVVVQADGSIVISGPVSVPGGGYTQVARLTPTGSLDENFGEGGFTRVTVPGQSNSLHLNVAAIQPDGKIILTNGLAAARLTANGDLDPTFGGGVVMTPPFNTLGTFRTASFDAVGATVGPDGRILIAGTIIGRNSNNFDKSQVAAFRLQGDATNPPSFLTLSPDSIPAATPGTEYNQRLAADGTATFAVTAGALPDGLSLATDGRLAGTPTATSFGVYGFTVTATSATATGSRSYTFVVNRGPVDPTLATLPSATAGRRTTGVTLSPGPFAPPGEYTYTITDALFTPADGTPAVGNVPFVVSGNQLGGVPFQAGTATFTIVARGDQDTGFAVGNRNYTIVVEPNPITITGPALPNFLRVGETYDFPYTAVGPAPHYDFSLTTSLFGGTLPPGLALVTDPTSNTARLTGTLTTAGSYSGFNLIATDPADGSRATLSFSQITVLNARELRLTTSSTTGIVGRNRVVTTVAVLGVAPGGVTIAVESGELPTGVTGRFNETLGSIIFSGVPTTAGLFTGTIRVTDTVGNTGTTPFNITIQPASASPPPPVSPPVSPPPVSPPPVNPPPVSPPPLVSPPPPVSPPPAVSPPPVSPPPPASPPRPVSPPAPSGSHVFLHAVGADSGTPRVRVFRVDGSSAFDFAVYEPTFTGGVRVATGDVNNDGTDDIFTAAGDGGGPRIVIFDGATGAVMRNFFAFEDTTRLGAFVAASDVNGDGFADYAVTAGSGGGPRVALFDGKSGERIGNDFLAFDANSRTGLTVAMGDITNSGQTSIIVGQLSGGTATRVFDMMGNLLSETTVYEPSFLGGVNVAVGDIDGNGVRDLLVGAGPGGGPRIRGFQISNGTLIEISNGFSFESTTRAGVRVGTSTRATDSVIVASFGGRIRSATVGVPDNGDEAPFGDDYLGGIWVS